MVGLVWSNGRENKIRDTLSIHSAPQTYVQAAFRERLRSKLTTELNKGFIKPSTKVKSFTHFFQGSNTWKNEG